MSPFLSSSQIYTTNGSRCTFDITNDTMISTTILCRPLLARVETRCMCRPFSSLNSILRAEGAPQRRKVTILQGSVRRLTQAGPTVAPISVRAQQPPARDAGEYKLPQLRSKQTNRIQVVQELLERAHSSKGQIANGKKTRATMEELQRDGEARALEKFQTRKWKQGDVYAPHDLTPAEMYKWKTRGRPTMDAFDALAINPLHEYKVRLSKITF